MKNGKKLYEIKWKNWDGPNSWEPAKNIHKSDIDEYNEL